MKTNRFVAGLGALAAAATALVGTTPTAHADGALTPNTTFTMEVHQDGTVGPQTDGAAIPNIDSVKSTLRAYYGATKGPDPAAAFSPLAPATTYLPNLETSPYAHNTEAVADTILADLPDPAPAATAVVFDVDSTLLSDYGNEEDMNFNYSPDLNAVWVNNALFPAVAGMPHLVQTLADEGYLIYGITGRPASQEPATLTNLAQQGYTSDGTAGGTPLFTADTLYTKDVANQPWVDCTLDGNAACSTVEYKALTREHIQNADAVTIAMNVGDQWSDLEGGFAQQVQKLPNPSYFLPSVDIPGAPSTDSQMVLPSTYTMAPDGSTGATATDGDALPNEGPVVTEIRNYYGATSAGIANKTSSPYITQMSSLESAWTPTVVSDCRSQVKAVSTAEAALATAQAKVSADQKTVAADQRAVTNATKAVVVAKAAVAKAKAAVKKAKTAKAKAAAKKRLAEAQKRLTSATKALATAKQRLATAKATLTADQRKLHAITVPAPPAVVFDADDTTLWTYDMEDGAMKFAFNPTVQDTDWVQPEKFPAVPGMPELVADVADAGCKVFGLTGRSDAQKYATLGNLSKVGYSDFRANAFFTKPSTLPAYVDCSTDGNPATCSTIDFKASTRAHIESMGYQIVGNFGDQFSDLIGGHADHTYKLPNPTYYLP